MEQAIFENFDFLVKVQVLLSQSFFFFFFFFFWQVVRTGSGFQVGPGQTEVLEDDIMRRGHVSALGASSAWLGEVACETGADDARGAWRRVAYRLGLKFLGPVDQRSMDLMV